MRRALIIVNPAAGRRRPLPRAREAESHLRAAGWEVRVEATRAHGHATEIAREHFADVDRIVVGGDGTLRESVLGVPPGEVTFGLVPLGNANVIARELGIPRTPSAAIALLGTGEPRLVDTGRVGEATFLAMVGVGWDGSVTRGVGRMRATGPGAWLYRNGGSGLVYAAAGIPALLRPGVPPLALEIDGKIVATGLGGVTVSNAETYALGWAMTPGARIDDGLLDHQANRRSAPPFLLWTVAAAMLRRRLPATVASYGRGRWYRVTAAAPFPWQVDGDPMDPVGVLDIEVVPRSLRILVPGDR